ncbi:MAG TPA: hypothetical protein VEW46_05735 [Pyrinomonadaceae bacterium]|nr:hypothetical protein [Pyrinomonadaceae bacterium]
MADEFTKHGPSYTEVDVADPVPWLEGLSEGQLRDWLRESIWTRNPLPVLVPPDSRLALELANVLKRSSSVLRARVRAVISGLVQEWGRDDSPETLDDLLILCGRLRCAAAEPAITLILNERLKGRTDEIPLMQRGLSVVSGFGCTERTVALFKRYITDVDYAAICYRALYRYDSRYGATELFNVITLFRRAEATSELDILIRILANDLTSGEIVDLLIHYLAIGDSEQILDGLEVLRGVGILTADLLLQARSDQRVALFQLLLERCAPGDYRYLLWKLRSIGIDLHCTQSVDGYEYIEVLISDTKTQRSVIENIISTDDLHDSALSAFVVVNERIASGSIMLPEPESDRGDWIN